MDDRMTKNKLLDNIREGRARWDGALAEVGDERMILPGVEGDWSVKDIIAHVNYYELALVRFLEGALRDEVLTLNPLTAGMNMDQRNAWVYENSRGRSIQDLLETVQALPESD